MGRLLAESLDRCRESVIEPGRRPLSQVLRNAAVEDVGHSRQEFRARLFFRNLAPGGKALARGFCSDLSIAARAKPFQLPPALGRVFVVSALMPTFVRLGLPLLRTPAFIRARLRLTGFMLIPLDLWRPVIPVGGRLIPWLRVGAAFIRAGFRRLRHPRVGLHLW